MIQSWGKLFKYKKKTLSLSTYINNIKYKKKFLTFGNARSYGDVCFLKNGNLVNTYDLKKIIYFDKRAGLIRAQSGVTIGQLLELIVPHGFFLNVIPGTKFVTLGGAIANDIHGKNHHINGNFGRFVNKIYIIRSNGRKYILSKKKNLNLFRCTIGGLGLTGSIEWVELKLLKIKSSNIIYENIRFNTLADYFKISEKSKKFSYSYAWLNTKKKFTNNDYGGIFTRGEHCNKRNQRLETHKNNNKVKIPNIFPNFFLNKFSIFLFNSIYQFILSLNKSKKICHYNNFFFPLDKILNWNNLYGSRGFYQFQFIISKSKALFVIREVLSKLKKIKHEIFLAALKKHGKKKAIGFNSFSAEGYSLAIDLPNNGSKTIQILKDLEKLVIENGGKLYPAKDAVMSSTAYKNSYPNWKKLEFFKDKNISSSFWERVTK
jgi:hypothetical protein